MKFLSFSLFGIAIFLLLMVVLLIDKPFGRWSQKEVAKIVHCGDRPTRQGFSPCTATFSRLTAKLGGSTLHCVELVTTNLRCHKIWFQTICPSAFCER